MANIFDIFKKKPKAQQIGLGDVGEVITPFKRTAWFPITEPRQSSRSAAKFSGVPALSAAEGWPCCQHCRQPMQLFVQLNSELLPEAAGKPFGNGYLQVFYCTNRDEECELVCEAFFPFSKSTLVRVLNFSVAETEILLKSPVADAFPEKAITGWDAQDDYPNREELEGLGCTLTEKQAEILCKLGYPLPKDKLLGWPCWVQGVEYPACPDCGKTMQLIFQIDSEDNLPYMFGDLGCSHITQCQVHKDKMAIAWACG